MVVQFISRTFVPPNTGMANRSAAITERRTAREKRRELMAQEKAKRLAREEEERQKAEREAREAQVIQKREERRLAKQVQHQHVGSYRIIGRISKEYSRQLYLVWQICEVGDYNTTCQQYWQH